MGEGPLVDWGFSCGRYFLKVAGYVAAMEGDPCREADLPVKSWCWWAIWKVVMAANGEVLDGDGKPQAEPTEWIHGHPDAKDPYVHKLTDPDQGEAEGTNDG